jgi:hypothetical protein
MGTQVKYFHSAMSGAPTLNGTAGTLIAVLDACLVNGFGSQTASSVVVASNVCTVTLPTTPAAEIDTVIRISGVTSPSTLNGDWRVTAISGNTISFATSGISDQTATGTIAVKMAPLDWAKALSGTNLAAYRSGDVGGTRMYLRVDDTTAQYARVVGYETMSDISTGTGPFPTSAQLSGGLYWLKANSTATTARGWTLIGDGKTFYLHVHTATTSQGACGTIYHFGDHVSTKAGDAYACYITGDTADVSTTTAVGSSGTVGITNNGTGKYRPRQYTGLGSSVSITQYFESYSYFGTSNSGYSGGVFPNAPDNSLLLTRVSLTNSSNQYGTLRGMWVCPQAAGPSFSWRDKVAGYGNLAGRKLLAIKGAGDPASTSTSSGVTFFDITGDWA